MNPALDKFIAELEFECACRRKECLPIEARRLAAEASNLFERIVEYMHNLRTEMDPYMGSGRQSRGWAHGAFREAQRIIDLTVDALCAGCGLHVPRDRSTGVRKSIAVFLLYSYPEQEPHPIGELRSGLKEVAGTQSIRRGRHALRTSTTASVTVDDLIWLRRKVKYPLGDLPDDGLHVDIERALRIADRIHAGFIELIEY